LFPQVDRFEDFAFEYCLPSANKWLQISVHVVELSELNAKPHFKELKLERN
jgi:hypothetical protein